MASLNSRWLVPRRSGLHDLLTRRKTVGTRLLQPKHSAANELRRRFDRGLVRLMVPAPHNCHRRHRFAQCNPTRHPVFPIVEPLGSQNKPAARTASNQPGPSLPEDIVVPASPPQIKHAILTALIMTPPRESFDRPRPSFSYPQPIQRGLP